MTKYDIYCEEILTGKTQVKKIYESDLVLAFYHTKPSFNKHIVVIPKECILDISHLDPSRIDLLSEIQKAIKISIEEIGNSEAGSGIKVVTNLGIYQHSPHLHFHVICGRNEIDG